MTVYIDIKDMAGYCLVEELKKDPAKKEFTFREIERYGLAIQKFCDREKEGTVLLDTKSHRKAFVRFHLDCIDYNENDEQWPSITLKEGVTIEIVREKIVSYMSLRLLEVILKYNPDFFEDE